MHKLCGHFAAVVCVRTKLMKEECVLFSVAGVNEIEQSDKVCRASLSFVDILVMFRVMIHTSGHWICPLGPSAA